MNLSAEDYEQLLAGHLVHHIERDRIGVAADFLAFGDLDSPSFAVLDRIERCILLSAIEELSEIMHIEPSVCIELMVDRAVEEGRL